jgi:membrane protease YdiL (CAAX protease family)
MARRSLINWLNDSNWRHQWNDAVLKDTSLYPLAALFIYGVLFYLLPIFFPLTRQWHGLPQFYFLVAALVILKKTHRSLNNIGLRREGILKEIAIGLLVSLVPLAVVAILLLQHNTPLSLVPAHFVQDLNLRLHRPAYLYQLFLLLLLAPLTEELFFRGVLTELLRSRSCRI